jgi:hypothetical protein
MTSCCRQPSLWRDDVTALAIGVAEQERCWRCGSDRTQGAQPWPDTVLVALEIDQTIMLLVPATLVTRRDTAVVVPAGVLRLAFDQTGERLALVQIWLTTLTTARRPGEVGFTLTSAIYTAPPSAKLIS